LVWVKLKKTKNPNPKNPVVPSLLKYTQSYISFSLNFM